MKHNEGKCYELALLALVSGKHGEKALLVHGYPCLASSRQKYGHAWIEYLDEDGHTMVYDPVGEKSFFRIVYYAVGQIDAQECRYYTEQEALKWGKEQGEGELYCSGPWECVPDDATFAADLSL